MKICAYFLTTKWITLGIIFLFKILSVSCDYPEHIIEDSCKEGNETIIYSTAKVGAVGTLKATSKSTYKGNKNCNIILVPPPGQGIVLSIRKLDFRLKSKYECQDYIEVYESDTFRSSTEICHFKFDLEEKLSFFSKGPMKIFFHAAEDEMQRGNFEEGFTLTFTAVYLDLEVCYKEDNFMCDNSRCISKQFICDGRNNCGDRSDESLILCDIDILSSLKLNNWIYAIILSVLISIILLAAIVFSYRRRHQKDPYATSDHDVTTTALTPYQAIHPKGYFICQNPAGHLSLDPSHSKLCGSDGGFSNPCYSIKPQAPPEYTPPHNKMIN